MGGSPNHGRDHQHGGGYIGLREGSGRSWCLQLGSSLLLNVMDAGLAVYLHELGAHSIVLLHTQHTGSLLFCTSSLVVTQGAYLLSGS